MKQYLGHILFVGVMSVALAEWVIGPPVVVNDYSMTAKLAAAGLPMLAREAEGIPPALVSPQPPEVVPATIIAVPPPTAPPVVTEAAPWPSDRLLAALRWCEASGNYGQIGTWDGHPSKYSGGYQFDQATWNDLARRRFIHLVGVYPAHASPADQDAMARALWNERGSRPWPTCGPKVAHLA